MTLKEKSDRIVSHGPEFPRTEAQLAARISEVSKKPFSFENEVLLAYAPFEIARPYLLSDFEAENWVRYPLNEAGPILETARDYAEVIGWDKIKNHRGISAGRTIDKMEAWLWLLGWDPDTIIHQSNWTNYGAPCLAAVCETLGFPIPEDEKIQRMIQGKPCVEGCDEGCV